MGKRSLQMRESNWGRADDPMINTSFGKRMTYQHWCLCEMARRARVDGRLRYLLTKQIPATKETRAYVMCCFSLSTDPNK